MVIPVSWLPEAIFWLAAMGLACTVLLIGAAILLGWAVLCEVAIKYYARNSRILYYTSLMLGVSTISSDDAALAHALLRRFKMMRDERPNDEPELG